MTDSTREGEQGSGGPEDDLRDMLAGRTRTLPRKSTKAELEERHRMVVQLRQMGYAAREIAGMLGVSDSAINRDLAAIRRATVARISPKRIHELVADAVLRFETLFQKAMVEFTAAPAGSLTRVRALEVALKANALQMKFMQDMRVVPKAPISLPMTFLDHPVLRGMTPEERVRIGLGIKKLMALMADEDVPGFDIRALGEGDGDGELSDLEPEAGDRW